MIRVAQLLLVLAAAGLWAASRLSWVSVRTFDGLGQPKNSTVDGATWSTALVPIAVLLLAAALAALAVRGRRLKAVAVLVAACCLALGYLGVGLLVMPDVAPRGAALAGVAIADLVGSQRHPWGAVITVGSAVVALVAAVLLMRSGAAADDTATRYRAAVNEQESARSHERASERAIWDRLDAGDDPTVSEGR